jgi:hypothetical protein
MVEVCVTTEPFVNHLTHMGPRVALAGSCARLRMQAGQEQLEWLAHGTMSILLDSEATNGQLLVARSHTSEGVASPTGHDRPVDQHDS